VAYVREYRLMDGTRAP